MSYRSSSGGTCYEKSVHHQPNTAVFPSLQLLTYAIRGTVIGGVWHTFSQQQPPSDPCCARCACERNLVPERPELFVRGLPCLRVFPIEQQLLRDLARRQELPDCCCCSLFDKCFEFV